eukprot:8135937-Pyramimonas_sp.AAC.2
MPEVRRVGSFTQKLQKLKPYNAASFGALLGVDRTCATPTPSSSANAAASCGVSAGVATRCAQS